MKYEYWVIFPQGIEQEFITSNNIKGVEYKNLMIASTKQEAINLLEKYDGAYFEQLKCTNKGREVIAWFADDSKFDKDITPEKLWDMWKDKPKITLRR